MTTPNEPEQTKVPIALVTGATGFIGGHLVRHLATHGWKVHVLSRRISSDPAVAQAATWHYYLGDCESASRAISLSQPDVVFHLASLTLVEHTGEQIDALIDANLRFGMHLLEAMSEHNVKKLINTGTSWQHYNGANYDPVNLYAATKQAFEAILDYYCNVHRFSATSVRLQSTYGPGDRRGKLLPLLLNAVLRDEKVELTPGKQKLMYVHVFDVAKAFEIISKRIRLTGRVSGSHERISLWSKEIYSIKELVAIIEKCSGRKIKALWGAKGYRYREVMDPCCLPSRMISWSPSIKLSEYIQETVEDMFQFNQR
jgi:nucleoside-diphosphate-sugar epimerase